MKIAVVGAGAIGSGVGALLHQAGHDVTLVGRPDHVAAIRRQGGLLVHDQRPGRHGQLLLPLPAAERLAFAPDILLVGTKVQDVADACRQSLPCARGAPAVMMQNGLSGDAIAGDVLGRENIIGCIVRFGVVYLKPGSIVRHSEGWLLIGQAFQPNGPRTQRVAEALNSGIRTILTDNIAGARWTKLLFNVQAALQAATGLSMQECSTYQEIRLLAMALVQETALVAEKAGVRLGPVDGISLEAVAAIRKLPPLLQLGDIPMEIMPLLVFTEGFSPMSSTLQSRRRGKGTEVDYLNGDVARATRAVGATAPLNERILQIMHELESRDAYLTPAELWAAMVTGARAVPGG